MKGRLFATGLLSFVLLLLGAQWVSYRSEVRELDARLAERRARVERLETLATRLQEFQKEVMRVEVKQWWLREAIPPAVNVAAFADRLAECMEAEAGVRILRLETESATNRREYWEVPIWLSVAGAPGAVDAALSRLATGRCPSDLRSPLHPADALGDGPPRLVGPARLVKVAWKSVRAAGVDLGLRIFAATEPKPPPGPAPSAAVLLANRARAAHGIGGTVWPFSGSIPGYDRRLMEAEERLRKLQAIDAQVTTIEAKKRDVAARQALVERLDASDARGGEGFGAFGDRHLEAGRYDEAIAAYSAVLHGSGGLVRDLGFVEDGKLYVREPSEAPPNQTGDLVALDPVVSRVVARHRLPGLVTSFTRRGDIIEIAYTASASPRRERTIAFSHGAFDRPVSLGQTFLAQRRALHLASSRLASGFLDRLLTDLKPGSVPEFPGPTDRIFGRPSRSLRDVEAALQAAARRDSTQPWHAFFLGAALWAQGKKDLAAETWDRILEGGFPGISYYEFAIMAGDFERLGLRPWADRAYEEALKRRRAIPEPILSTSEFGRLINEPFLAVAAAATEAGFDIDRQHIWLQRAREISGFCWGDDLTAAAWETYFRGRGETEKAALESAEFEKARRDPWNPLPRWAELEYALYALLAIHGALWALLALGLPGSVSHTPQGEPRPGRFLPTLIAAVPGPRRQALTVAGLLALVSAALYVRAANRVGAREAFWVPAGDSLSARAPEMEQRATATGAADARYAAAVLDHMAGNRQGARQLYQSLPGDSRARENLAALERGEPAPQRRLTSEEFLSAWESTPWTSRFTRFLRLDHLFVSSYLFEGFPPKPPSADFTVFVRAWLLRVAALTVLVTPLLSVVLFVVFSVIPPLAADSPPAPPEPAGWGSKIAYGLMPGVLDMRRMDPWRGYLTFALFGLACLALLFFDPASPVPGVLTPSSATWTGLRQPYFSGVPWPIPQYGSRAYWTRFWAHPGAIVFWPMAGLAALASFGLHASRLRRIVEIRAPVASGVCPRWFLRVGWLLVAAQVLMPFALVVAAHLEDWQAVWQRSETLAHLFTYIAPPAVIAGPLGSLVAAALGVFFFVRGRRRGVRPRREEWVLFAIVSAETTVVLTLLFWALWVIAS